MSEKSKSATIKVRPLIAAQERGPGPGRYALPTTFGNKGADPTRRTAPASSFGLRPKSSKKDKSPGPNYIDPKVSRFGSSAPRAPAISGRPKQKPAEEVPAANAYGVHTVAPVREKKAPAYSMGARAASAKRMQGPSPNSYNVPATLGSTFVAKHKSAPNFSMTGRSGKGGFAEDNKKTPGPGTYAATTADKKKAPAYTMSARFQPLSASLHKNPGPGSHNPESVTFNKKKAPAFSMGTRHSAYTTPLIVDVPDN